MTLMLYCNQMIPKLYAFAKILCGVTVHLLLMCVWVCVRCALLLFYFHFVRLQHALEN